MLERQLLITGCPRSGTRYTAKLLQKTGVRVGHEALGEGGAVCSFLAVDDFFYGGLHNHRVEGQIVRRRDISFQHVWQQVRNPKDVIDSCLTAPLRAGIWHWYGKHVDVDYDLPAPEMIARFWVDWNELAEKQSEWTFRAEDIDSVWPEILERLGVEFVPVTSGVNRMLGAIQGERYGFEWSELKPETEDLVRTLARKYGYE